MELRGPFYINGKEYSKDGLLAYSKELIAQVDEGGWEHEVYQFVLDFFDEEKEIVQFTSGTTGAAKAVVLERGLMFQSAARSLKYFELGKGDSVLLCLSVKYIAGKMMLVRALLGGLNVVLVSPSSNPFTAFEGEVDFAAMVPMQVHQALEEGADFGRLGKLIVGGGSLSRRERERVLGLGGCEVYETFGMSETYTHIAVKRISGDSADEFFSVLEGVKCGVDARGCLVIDSFGDGGEKVLTNDLVEMEGEDRFRWLGRIDNVINSGGVKIIPEVLEEQMRELIPRDFYLGRAADEKLGERMVLYVEGVEDFEAWAEWEGRLRIVLGEYEMPREMRFVREFERTESGKVKRSVCLTANNKFYRRVRK